MRRRKGSLDGGKGLIEVYASSLEAESGANLVARHPIGGRQRSARSHHHHRDHLHLVAMGPHQASHSNAKPLGKSFQALGTSSFILSHDYKIDRLPKPLERERRAALASSPSSSSFLLVLSSLKPARLEN